jgi:hypothetical protein
LPSSESATISETAIMPANGNQKDRINHDITDIGSIKDLLSYAAAGQFAHVARQHRVPNRRRDAISQEMIAKAAGFGAGSNLSTALRTGLTPQKLRDLDDIIGALAPDLERTGGLSSLDLRLSAERRADPKGSVTARVPPSWTRTVLHDPPANEIGVLIQASALLSTFMSAGKLHADGPVTRIRDHYREEMDQLVRRLILVSAGPPTPRNYDAQILLGMLASYAFEDTKDLLESELRYSPLGFRVWRAITKLVSLSSHGEHADALRGWVRWLVTHAEDLRKDSLYPGRGLDLELAISVPEAWSPPGDDWAGAALLTRARADEATIRERGTAVMGLWQRAISGKRADQAQIERHLRGLIAEFRDGHSRPDAAGGLEWIAATLKQVMDGREAVCNEFPDEDRPWFRRVQEVAGEIDAPDHLLEGTRSLFRHMLLQNAGVYRRRAIETVVTSGWNDPVARALGSLLNRETDETWLRIRAEFALGLMQRQSEQVERDLTAACRTAYENLRRAIDGPGGRPSRAQVNEMHSSLFAVGDCFGVAGAEKGARRVRANIQSILRYFADMEEPGLCIMVGGAARAAAYALTMTAQPSQPDRPDLSKELLTKLRGHPDPVTARLSNWALGFRFAGDGTIRPLWGAADVEHDDPPEGD